VSSSSAVELRAETRGVLLRLALTSIVSGRGLVGRVTSSAPDSAPPMGETHADVEALAVELASAGDDVAALDRLLRRARTLLDAIVRRPLAGPAGDRAIDLAAEVVRSGEGWDVRDVSIALRCTPTFVRRARLAAGRDAESGRALSIELVNGTPVVFGVELVRAGYSLRAASAISGVARSTLHDRARR
jgi:hypothetical protein